MPAFSSKRPYTLTSTQVDLILYCLEYASNLTIDEDNERRKIVDTLMGSYSPSGYVPVEDPYQNLCDI